jgi:tetratricopeptide (TPR) repeat protein
VGKQDEAIAAYDALIAGFEDASEPALREQFAGALFNKSITLGQLNRTEKAIAVYDALIARFEDASEPVLREQVAKALNNKRITLGRSNARKGRSRSTRGSRENSDKAR